MHWKGMRGEQIVCEAKADKELWRQYKQYIQ